MKKILFVFAIFSLAIVSCGETKKEEVIEEKVAEKASPSKKRGCKKNY